MILWIILVIVAIIVLILLWWFNTEDITHYPTVHARCRSNTTCGGDLICDLNCNRCRKQVNGDCSADNDCQSGLICYNWKCVPEIPLLDNTIEDTEQIKHKTDKSVRWNEHNEIRYFV